MSRAPLRVLFLCTGNSARSIMAEALLNTVGAGRFEAHSAGSAPAGRIHPFTLDLLARYGHAIGHLRSKSWDEFAAPGAPHMELVITVCDNAAGEFCPVWPGHPVQLHWPFEDPAAFQGSDEDKRRRFEDVYEQIRGRVAPLAKLPAEALDASTLRDVLGTIEKTRT